MAGNKKWLQYDQFQWALRGNKKSKLLTLKAKNAKVFQKQDSERKIFVFLGGKTGEKE